MKKTITLDGSETFVNEEYNESYHSYTGAVEEALKKYCEPTGIEERAKNSEEITILDFAFGMGYNSAMAISVIKKANPKCKVNVIGLENDPKIIEKIVEVNPDIFGYEEFKHLNPKNLMHRFHAGLITVEILLGDAHKTIKKIMDDTIDVIFYDPFSPKTQPDMWTKELFEQVYRILKKGKKESKTGKIKGGVLATYSCARVVRDNMKAAGLSFDDGPKVGRRGPGTLAWKE